MTSTRRLLLAALISATASLGWCAPASAQPEWDIERYDDCMKTSGDYDPSQEIAWTRKCCLDSGGVWSETLGKCQAPPAEPAKWQPGLTPRPGAITEAFEPTPPPVLRAPVGVLTQT